MTAKVTELGEPPGVEFTDLTDQDIKLESPFRMQITGSSHSGKSTFMLNMIKYRDLLLQEQFGKIIYCYPSDDGSPHVREMVERLKDEFDNLEIIRGLPEVDLICQAAAQTGDHCLLLMDDLASEIATSDAMQSLFTRHSHHSLISVIFTTQTFSFFTKKHGNDIPSNVTHHVLFR
jgi:hypothetical protein